ncbi:MAG: family 10 glycosylhydrolase [Bacteroidota bacterium]
MKNWSSLIGTLFLLLCACASEYESVEKDKGTPTRGIWLTNVDSEVLFSEKGIKEAVDLCVEYGFNTIYTVVWNRGYTLCPSEIMERVFCIKIDPKLEGRDPLQKLIEYAHTKDIRVIAWFEFGFSSSYEEKDGGYLLRQKPEWAALDVDGKLVSKNGFQWMNAFDPEVRSFITSLLKEVVQNYEVDGIQGDDRLPALPSTAGYDSLTIAIYEAEFGTLPPRNYRDSLWVDWRAKKLNQYVCELYQELKALDTNLVISMAPSIYPWSKEEYLQDWVTWVREGCVDEIIPQIYRYDIDKYKAELDKIITSQIEEKDLFKLAVGILLKVGDYYASPEFLQAMIYANRANGVQGEVFFFYEGLKKHPEFFEELY